MNRRHDDGVMLTTLIVFSVVIGISFGLGYLVGSVT